MLAKNFKYLIVIILILVVAFFYYFYMNKDKQPQKIELKEVTLRLQWHIQTQFAGYYVALSKGYYQDASLKVNVEQGGYGKSSLSTVRAGLEEFGTKWMADLVASNDSLISLANIVKDNGLYLVSKKSKNIKSVDDFKNRKVSIWFIGNEYQLFALLDKNKIEHKELEIIPQKWDLSQFNNDEVDVVSVMSYNELLTLCNSGINKDSLNIFDLKKLGVGFPGQNIFTNIDYYNKNQEICEKFIKASLKGWQYAINNPEEATNIVLKYDNEHILNKAHQQKQMKEIIKLINPKNNTLGYQNLEHYQFIEKIYKKYGIIKKEVDVQKYFTNQFIEVK